MVVLFSGEEDMQRKMIEPYQNDIIAERKDRESLLKEIQGFLYLKICIATLPF